MSNPGEERSGLSATDVAILGEREALQRLELLASTSRILDATLEDYDHAVMQVADACVPDFADMCAIEVIGPDGDVRTAAFRFARTSGLHLPDEWVPIGRQVSPDRRPVLTFANSEETESYQAFRERFRGQSLMVVPITGGGLTLGWFVAATGAYRTAIDRNLPHGFTVSRADLAACMLAMLADPATAHRHVAIAS